MSADRPDIFADPGDDPNLEPWEQPGAAGADCWDAAPEQPEPDAWAADSYVPDPPAVADPGIRVTVDLDELLRPKLELGPAVDLLDRYEREARHALAAAGFGSPEAVWRAVWTDGARLGGDRVSWAMWEYRGLLAAVVDVRRMMGSGVDVQAICCQFARLGELRQRARSRAVEQNVLRDRSLTRARQDGHQRTYGTPEDREARNAEWRAEARRLRETPQFAKKGIRALAEEIAKTTTFTQKDDSRYAAETIRGVLKGGF